MKFHPFPASRALARSLGGPLAALSLLLGLGSLVACSPKGAAPGAESAAPPAAGGDARIEPASAADDQAIRKALAERLKQLPPIDEVRKTSVAGLFEVRFGGSQILYTDASGRYVVEGSLIDTQSMTNLTEARLDALTAVKFDELPLRDAMVFKQGDGSRKLAVFADPNCGYCRRFERDLLSLPNATIYTFIMPILGNDSVVKARNIWCTADPAKTWRSWMLDGVAAPAAGASCDASALVRNAELGRKHRINGTPGLVFVDGSRRSGALPLAQLEAMIVAAGQKS